MNELKLFDLDLIQSKIILAEHNQTSQSTNDEKINDARKSGYLNDIVCEYLTLATMNKENKQNELSKEMTELGQRFMSITTLTEDPNLQLILSKLLEDILDEQLNQTHYHLSLIENEKEKLFK